ncbi:MAG TPA: hypothetical protein VGF45_21250 [Polyangia bacterium]
MKTKSVSAQSATGENDESPFASKGAGKKGGLSFGKVLSQSSRALAGKSGVAPGEGVGKLGEFAGQLAREVPQEQGQGDNGKAGLGKVIGNHDTVAPAPMQGNAMVEGDEAAGIRMGLGLRVGKAAVGEKAGSGQANARMSATDEGQPQDLGEASPRGLKKVGEVSAKQEVAAEGAFLKGGVEGAQRRAGDEEAAGKRAFKAETTPVPAETAANKGIAALVRKSRNMDLTGEGGEGVAGAVAVKDLTQAAVARNSTANTKEDARKAGEEGKAGKAAANQEAQGNDLGALEAVLAGPRSRLGRGTVMPGSGEGAAGEPAFIDSKAPSREEGRARQSTEEGKPNADAVAALSVLQVAGLIDLRKSGVHAGAAGEDEGGGITAATGNANEAAAADLAATLSRELERPAQANQPTFTLPPPPPPVLGGPSGVGDVAPTIAPGTVLAPAELGMVPEDPALNVAVLNRAAHLSIEGQDGRSLELHVRLLPEGAEIRANGELAPLVQSKASDLGAALAAEGMTLNRFELASDHRHNGDGGQRDPRAGDDGDFYRPANANVRRAAAHVGAVETVTRAADGRIHVKA